jgi:glycosyltransferase involved in cell wall biosynthesis
MKILYATRLFTGLESSLSSKKWFPTGVPTIYKIIEELDKRGNTKFIFSVKDSGDGYLSSWNYSKDELINIAGLNSQVKVLAGSKYFFSWLPRRVAFFFREIRQYICIIVEALRFKPDIIYCDHANVIVAALLARVYWKSDVVFRVMGVYPSMRESLKSKSLINKIYKWAYSSPFSLVICTQDGSGVESWLKQAISKDVKIEVILNGVDMADSRTIDIIDTQLKKVPLDKKIILFIGKFEKYKGCYDFLNAFCLLIDKEVDEVHALMIGTGSEEISLKKIVKERKIEHRFSFISRLPHSQILAAHRISDVYVSMNHLGNLSNSNLEAIQSNICMVIASPQPKDGIDIITNKLLGNSVDSVPINSPVLLADRINQLIFSKKTRDEKLKLLKLRKKSFLKSWDERIEIEIMLLEQIIISKNES